ncbi:class I SAM-dependent methyltransferase [Candidatus Methylospira mobilis]|uniref:Class I SAM-dependent methyltransferase n=1 Tax=Candidatus Methylospira mobilis TaxID=1808979 RepID=A0A5Q0BIL9_9GAMM|nr:class I SAM-dependent methyltransferase [Candidatus Methylospira mobilis]QFY42051.1 class I SAM-dependent methyltransferase [Candidatus Methylospira mobilis]WNV03058.1 class I SAM-dependent methyltransferase [Candidatus Methylospira mobilis]
MDPNTSYRSRIYSTYVNARNTALAPESLEGLKPRAVYLTHLIRSHFPDNRQSDVLELGCGHGAMIYFARKEGYVNIGGVDGSPEQVAAARRLGIAGVDEGDLMQALAALPDESKDCIVAFDVIEHFTRDELIRLVDEVRRVLRPGGRWIIHVPNGESPFAGRMRYWDITHELAFTHTSIGQLLHSSGFSEVRSYEDAPIPHGFKSFVRWLLWRFFRAMLRLYIAAETGDTESDCIFSQNLLAVAKK